MDLPTLRPSRVHARDAARGDSNRADASHTTGLGASASTVFGGLYPTTVAVRVSPTISRRGRSRVAAVDHPAIVLMEPMGAWRLQLARSARARGRQSEGEGVTTIYGPLDEANKSSDD